MVDNKESTENKLNSSSQSQDTMKLEVWKEYEEFLKAHQLQLYGMGFPVEKLGEKLFYKLKYEIFEPNIFTLIDNQEEEKFIVQSNKEIKKENDVFLIDHCWTFQIRRFYDFVKQSPEIIERVFKMLKYSDRQINLPESLKNPEEDEDKYTNFTVSVSKYHNLDKKLKEIVSKFNNAKASSLDDEPESCILNNNFLNEDIIINEYDKIRELHILNYDNMDLKDTDLNKIFISKLFTYGLNIENNEIADINSIVKLVLIYPNIKAIWLDGNNFSDEVDVFKILSQIKSLELINGKFTNHVGKFTADYLENRFNPFSLKSCQEKFKETNNKYKTSTNYYLDNTSKCHNLSNFIDFSFSSVFDLNLNSIKKLLTKISNAKSVTVVDLKNALENEKLENSDSLISDQLSEKIELFLSFFSNVEKVNLNLYERELFEVTEDVKYVKEDNDEIQKDESTGNNNLPINALFKYIIENYNTLKLNYPKLKYINDLSIDDVIKECSKSQLVENSNSSIIIDLDFINKFAFYLKTSYVQKNMWKILGSYRLVTSEKFDENITWYINDEIGSAIYSNHSDSANIRMYPLIFSKTNDFKTDAITYTILWPCKNIKEKETLSNDNLINVDETRQRSAKLTLWFNTPAEYFKEKFENKLLKLKDAESSSESINQFNLSLQNYHKLNKENNNLVLNEEKDKILQMFDFSSFNQYLDKKILDDKQKSDIMDYTINNILQSLTNYNNENQSSINNQFELFASNKVEDTLKVFSDLEYVRSSLSKPFVITEDISEADIIWLNYDYYQLDPLYSNILVNKDKLSSNNSKFKKNHFKNQFPFEARILMKYHLMTLIQDNRGYADYFSLSYDLETELAEFIGNYLYNSSPYDKVPLTLSYKTESGKNEIKEIHRNNCVLDNSWILKPINMARSMDMIVTNNLSEIIRYSDTGPKICQKYISNPYLMNSCKFDFRYMILVKSLAPIEIYIYTKVFWFRTANNNFTMDYKSFTDYETHFTVMNYDKKESMKQIFDHDFLEYLKKQGVEYSEIYKRLCSAVKDIFVIASYKCPQMIDAYAKAIYAIDVMIDEKLQPKILEFNFSPDCTRAVKYTPSFYQDIFRTLFLNTPTNAELI